MCQDKGDSREAETENPHVFLTATANLTYPF